MDVHRETRDGILRLTLDRPDKANTLTVATRDLFVAALREAEDDDGVAAVLLDAAPAKVFSGGVDLSNPDDLPPPALAQRRASIVFDMAAAMLDFTKPLVVAVGGAAIGGGCIVAVLGDRILCTPAATFALPEIRLGIPSFVAAELAAHRLGAAMARDMVLFGEAKGAADLARCGAAVVVEGAGRLAAAARDEATRLSSLPRSAFRELKAWMAQPLRQRLRPAIDRTLARNALESSHVESAAAIRRVLD